MRRAEIVRRNAMLRQIHLAEMRILEYEESLKALGDLRQSEWRDQIMDRYRSMILGNKLYILKRKRELAKPPEEKTEEPWP